MLEMWVITVVFAVVGLLAWRRAGWRIRGFALGAAVVLQVLVLGLFVVLGVVERDWQWPILYAILPLTLAFGLFIIGVYAVFIDHELVLVPRARDEAGDREVPPGS